MVIMRNWRIMETQSPTIQTTMLGSSSKNTKVVSIFDPKEGTSKQYDDSNQSIYSGPTAKKTPSTPECEEVLEELRKKYYNPKEGTSKQYESNYFNVINKSPTSNIPRTPETTKAAHILYDAYKKRYFSPQQSNSSAVGSAQSAMELLRSCIQYAFDQEVDLIVKKFIQLYFVPAMKNLKQNLGENSISEDALCNICCSLLENSKNQYFISQNTNISSPATSLVASSSASSTSSTSSITTEMAASLSTATTPKMELSETESENSSQNYSSTGTSILQQALKRRRIDETETEDDTAGEEISDELLGKIAEEISEEDLSQAFSFEDSLLSDIPCLSLSPPPLLDVLNSDTTDFKVPLPPIETIKGVCAPFSSLFVPNTEPCFDLIDFDFD